MLRCAASRLAALLLLLALPAAATAARGPLLLGVQDDALLTSAEPDAWPLAAPRSRPGVIRFNVAWNAVAADPAGRRGRPRRPGLPLRGRRPRGAPGRRDRRRAAADAGAGAGAGPTAARRRRARRSTPPPTGASAAPWPAATRGTFTPAGADAPLPRGAALHRLERAEPRAVPAAAGPRRPDRGAHRGPAGARLRARGARRQPRRPRRPRPAREPRRPGRPRAARLPAPPTAAPAARGPTRSRSTPTSTAWRRCTARARSPPTGPSPCAT